MNLFLPFITHHWLLSALFVILLIAIIITEMLTKAAGAQGLSPHEAVQLINKSDAIVVDLRTKDAFVRGHIINAVNVPFSTLQKGIEKLIDQKHKPIILVCAQGVESAKAAKMIQEKEFESVSLLRGGLRTWLDEKLPLEKGA